MNPTLASGVTGASPIWNRIMSEALHGKTNEPFDRPGDVAVFWRLRELVPGDTFEIDRADGSTAKFKVDAVKQVPQSNFPTEEVYGNIDFAGIRLITCGGTFNRTTRHYSDNTIVFGSLITDNKPANSTSQ